MTGNDARRTFLDYFKHHSHQVVRSSSLVPHDDPTLLFINAGMVQFKRVFLGEEKRDYLRATTSQKCVRAGGKHNDLENVGYTARHHTFFEMLGNFSFGDYFKERAVVFAWDLLTNGYRLPADKLYASIYLDDDEAYGLWCSAVGLPDRRIVRFGEKKVARNMSQLPRQPSMQRLQIPDWGATFRERLAVCRASLAFGR